VRGLVVHHHLLKHDNDQTRAGAATGTPKRALTADPPRRNELPRTSPSTGERRRARRRERSRVGTSLKHDNDETRAGAAACPAMRTLAARRLLDGIRAR
jgi:hypothetical protein